MNSSLIDKLGLKPEMSMYFHRAPTEYWAELGMRQQPYNDIESEYEFIHAFFTDRQEMDNFADILLSKLSPTGMLWISWVKQSARHNVASDITEQDIRDIFLPLGLVDTKVCSVSDTWSALKLVWRKA